MIDVPTLALIRRYGDEFGREELLNWSDRFRGERNLRPLTLWATVVDSIMNFEGFGDVESIPAMERIAAAAGLGAIRMDAENDPFKAMREAKPRIDAAFASCDSAADFLSAETGSKPKKKPAKVKEIEQESPPSLFDEYGGEQ